jgi:hypothetical protein
MTFPSPIRVEFEVSGVKDLSESPLRIVARIFPSTKEHSFKIQPVALCEHGGSYTWRYYHLEVPGQPADEYSMAQYLADQGIIVVAFDALGVGESRCDVNGHLLTPEKQGEVHHLMVQQIREELAAGTLLPEVTPGEQLCVFGVGHSMGAIGIVTQQALLRSYEAIALLGYGHNAHYPDAFGETLLRELGIIPSPSASPVDLIIQGFQAATNEQGYTLFPRKALHLFFHDETVPSFVIEADDRYATAIPGGVALYAGLEALGNYASVIDVPVFLGNAAQEGFDNFRAEPTHYPRTPDITLFELEGAAHCHNFTPRRRKLWQRISAWMWSVTAGKAAV